MNARDRRLLRALVRAHEDELAALAVAYATGDPQASALYEAARAYLFGDQPLTPGELLELEWQHIREDLEPQ